MGSRKIVIDWDKVDEWLAAGSTGVECAAMLGIHPDTLYRSCETEHKVGFAAYSAERKAKGCLLLRHVRFKKAIKEGDNTMLIWLSKQMLGETDKQHNVIETPDIKIEVEIIFPESNQAPDED